MGGIFSKPKLPPPPPPPPEPEPMPDPDPEASGVAREKRAKIVEQQKRSGRASTILSQGGGGEKLGG